MMHFRSLKMDLCHVFLNGHATQYHTWAHGYLQVVHDAKNVCSELRTQIFNFKMERCPYFLYSQKKTNASHAYCIAFMCTDGVAESCLSVLSLVWANQSEMLVIHLYKHCMSIWSVKWESKLYGVKLVQFLLNHVKLDDKCGEIIVKWKKNVYFLYIFILIECFLLVKVCHPLMHTHASHNMEMPAWNSIHVNVFAVQIFITSDLFLLLICHSSDITALV